ncbi:MAG: hypothetical protein E7246_04205 [Lachnoclostridium sp.]|nr:hypothetical protein [Lachnoclostridium sp.]
MEIEKIYEELNNKLADAERVLVGLGAEWKVRDEAREAQIMEAAKTMKRLLEGKDYFVISTLSKEELDRFGWIDFKTVAPLDEAMTEEQWNGYMNWLSRTLNRKLVILELGEGFMQPTVIRWPFEKTVMINQKSCMYRVHKTFYQIADEIKERAVAVKADSVEFVAQWKEN